MRDAMLPPLRGAPSPSHDLALRYGVSQLKCASGLASRSTLADAHADTPHGPVCAMARRLWLTSAGTADVGTLGTSRRQRMTGRLSCIPCWDARS